MTASGSLLADAAIDAVPDALLAELQRALTAARFDLDFLATVEGVAARQHDQLRLPIVRWWLNQVGPEDKARAVLADLFAYAGSQRREDLDPALGKGLVDALLAASLLAQEGERVAARFRLMPFCGVWIASDEMDAQGDPVMGPGATTQVLAAAFAARPGERVLDVGCGAGSLALAAAHQGAASVTGVDLMPRAITWSRFNARLNRLPDGVSTRFLEGDLTAPVKGEQFDLIVSQPPYVMQPEAGPATTYLHGGQRGDELALRLLAELPALLAPGGRALVLFDSPIDGAMPVDRRIDAAIGDPKLRRFVLTQPGADPDTLAIAYSIVRHKDLGPSYAEAAARARARLCELGITGNKQVLVLLARPKTEATGLLFAQEVPRLSAWPAEALDALQHAASFAAQSEAVLKRAQVRPAPGAWLCQEVSFSPTPTAVFRVRFDHARHNELSVSPSVATLLEQAAQAGTVAELIDHYAKASEAEPSEVAPQVLGFVRNALLAGMLVPG